MRGSDERADLGQAVSHTDADAGSVFAGPPPWASIQGADVCPRCQTSDELDDSARRVVVAIEAEIQRLSSSGADSKSTEAGLIGYAMGLRERLAEAAPGAPPPPEQNGPEPQP